MNPATAVSSVEHISVDEESAGQRLDNFLLRQLKGVPKTLVYRIIRSGEVRVNRGRASADTRIRAGDSVRLPPLRRPLPPTGLAAAQAAAPPRAFTVLFEDEQLIALDKPAGVAVHGGSGVSFGVIEQLRAARPEARFLELVHRLDRDTSGVLLIAKKRSALTRLQAQFRAREIAKTYLALVAGDWPANRKVLDQPLHKFTRPDGERRVKVVDAQDPDGMRAVTLVKLAQRLARFSLLEVTIKTGRTHQIRVHLASAGHGIAGDDKYGDFELNKTLQRDGLKRMFLHAWRLGFTHPATEEPLQLQSELPPELAGWLSRIGPAA